MRGRFAYIEIASSDQGREPQLTAQEFEQEALHQTIRQRVAQANQKLREYITIQALCACQQVKESGSPALDPGLEKQMEKLFKDIDEKGGGGDPLGITIPWEQKHKRAPIGK
ncbi:MAG: hypothetical protein WC881_00775 [Elusimicrobiota bacterium]